MASPCEALHPADHRPHARSAARPPKWWPERRRQLGCAGPAGRRSAGRRPVSKQSPPPLTLRVRGRLGERRAAAPRGRPRRRAGAGRRASGGWRGGHRVLGHRIVRAAAVPVNGPRAARLAAGPRPRASSGAIRASSASARPRLRLRPPRAPARASRAVDPRLACAGRPGGGSPRARSCARSRARRSRPPPRRRDRGPAPRPRSADRLLAAGRPRGARGRGATCSRTRARDLLAAAAPAAGGSAERERERRSASWMSEQLAADVVHGGVALVRVLAQHAVDERGQADGELGVHGEQRLGLLLDDLVQHGVQRLALERLLARSGTRRTRRPRRRCRCAGPRALPIACSGPCSRACPGSRRAG